MALSIRTEEGKIIIDGSSVYNPKIYAGLLDLHNSRWNKARKRFELPATPFNAGAVSDLIDDVMPQNMAISVGYSIGFQILETRRTDTLTVDAEDQSQPKIRRTDAWPHQIGAYHFANKVHNALLWCGVGTGKSKVSIDVFQNMKFAKLALIVAPNHIHLDQTTWKRQVDTHCAFPFHFESLTKGTSKTKAKRLKYLIDSASAHTKTFVTINYESVWRTDLGKVISDNADKIDLLILDESHRLKSHDSSVSKFFAGIAHKFPKILMLTGTALPKNQLDAFGQFRILDSGIFGKSWVNFRNRYADIFDYGGVPIIKGFVNQTELLNKMKPLTHIVDESVLKLPEPIHDIRTFELSKDERDAYVQMEADCAVELRDVGYTVTSNILTQLLRLQQITGGNIPLNTTEGDNRLTKIGESKEAELFNLLQDFPSGAKIVVFARFRADLEAIERVARKLERPYCQIGGDRHEKDLWNSYSSSIVMGINVQAGSGLDLSDSNYGVFYSTGYLSVGDFMQCVGRLRRPPNDRFCYFYHLHARGTLDEAIFKGLQSGRNMLDGAVDYLKSLRA